MFLGYFFIVCRLTYGAITSAAEYFPETYAPTGNFNIINVAFLHLILANLINALHVMAFLEALHCYAGFTGGKVMTVLMQCIGRATICAYLNYHSRAQTSAFVFLLFAAWSMGEVIRYPYYMSTVSFRNCYIFKSEVSLYEKHFIFQIMRKRMPRLEWLRYSAFIILYPLGLIGELGVINATIYDITAPSEFYIHVCSFD